MGEAVDARRKESLRLQAMGLPRWQADMIVRDPRYRGSMTAEDVRRTIVVDPEVGELGEPLAQLGSVAQSLGRQAVDRGNANRAQVVAYMLSDQYDEGELWNVLGPLIDEIEEGALAGDEEDDVEEDEDDPGLTSLEARGQTMPADFEDDEPGLVLQPPVFDAVADARRPGGELFPGWLDPLTGRDKDH